MVVWVTVNELKGISAYDNANVSSFGKLSEINLDVNLYDHASASLDIDSFSADIKVNDHAKANLTGNASECNLTYSQASTVNQSAFNAEHFNKVVKLTYKSDDELLAALAK